MRPNESQILTLNGGFSSIKFALFEAGDSLRRILEGGIVRIGLPDATLRVKGLNRAEGSSRPDAANADAISTATRKVSVHAMRTDEERTIAKEVCRVLSLNSGKEP